MFSAHAIKVPILNLKVSHSSDTMIGYFWQCRPPMDDDKDPNESVFKHPEDTSGPYVASLLPVLPPGPLLGIHAAHVTLHPQHHSGRIGQLRSFGGTYPTNNPRGETKRENSWQCHPLYTWILQCYYVEIFSEIYRISQVSNSFSKTKKSDDFRM